MNGKVNLVVIGWCDMLGWGIYYKIEMSNNMNHMIHMIHMIHIIHMIHVIHMNHMIHI